MSMDRLTEATLALALAQIAANDLAVAHATTNAETGHKFGRSADAAQRLAIRHAESAASASGLPADRGPDWRTVTEGRTP